MRVSDIERQRAIDELRRHCGAGRIDVDEYASRIEQALGATTLEELDQLLGDLPMLRIADPDESTRSNGRPPRSKRSKASQRSRAAPGWADPSGEGDSPAARGGSSFNRRLGGSLVILISVAVVLAAVTVAVLSGWLWALVLLIGWVVGLAQGRVGRARNRHRL